MKILLFTLITILITAPAFAQKQFEGKIVYELKFPQAVSQKDDMDGNIVVLFGKNAIRIRSSESKPDEQIERLIRLDSGKVYAIDLESKTYAVERLRKTPVIPPPVLQPETIAGYATTPVHLGRGKSTNAYFYGALQYGEIVFHVANDLYYIVPEEYSGSEELMFISGNKIVLGAKLSYSVKSMLGERYDEEVSKEDSITMTTDLYNIIARAVSVEPGAIDEKEFLIPPGFVKESTSDLQVDTTVVIDSVSEEDIIEPPPPPPPKKPVPKKAVPKATNKGEMKKPE